MRESTLKKHIKNVKTADNNKEKQRATIDESSTDQSKIR